MLQKRIPFFIAAGGLSLQSYGVFLSESRSFPFDLWITPKNFQIFLKNMRTYV